MTLTHSQICTQHLTIYPKPPAVTRESGQGRVRLTRLTDQNRSNILSRYFSLSRAVSPAKVLHVSGVFEMSSSEPMESECSAEGLLRGGKGEISVSLASWAKVSRRRRRFRLLVGVVRERRDTAFFIAGLSDWVTETRRWRKF